MTRNVIIAIVVVVILGAAGWYMATQTNNVSPVPNTSTQTGDTSLTKKTPVDSATSPASFTMADVAKHNSLASCYSAIRGSVYDLTAWISQHPGGEEAILSICGKDGTNAFVGQHGGSPQQESILATFKLGTLAQ